VVEIWFHDEPHPERRAKPRGTNGGVLFFTWGKERITDVELLTKTTLMTRSPFRLELPPESQGSFLSCAIRWQSTKGIVGSWSDVQHVMIT
jgi:hypothetical protein